MSNNRSGDRPEDLEDLARRYVDLWQDQMTAMAADPDFADSLQKVMASMGTTASSLPAMWAAWPAAMTSLMAAAQPRSHTEGRNGNGAPASGPEEDSGVAATPGAAAAAASPDGGGHDLGDLAERLAALEQRVLALEGGTGRTRSRPKRKPKRS